MSAQELDREAVKRKFHKRMEQGSCDTLSTNFMDFFVRAFSESEQMVQARDTCVTHHDEMMEEFKRIAFRITKSDFT